MESNLDISFKPNSYLIISEFREQGLEEFFRIPFCVCKNAALLSLCKDVLLALLQKCPFLLRSEIPTESSHAAILLFYLVRR